MKQSVLSLTCRLLLLLFCTASVSNLCAAESKRVLVVTVTKGFRHGSIPTAIKVLGDLAQSSGAFTVDYVSNDKEMAMKMTAARLGGYDAFIFANTTGELPLPDKSAFLAAIRGGKGFVGMHSASDTFHGEKDVVDPYIEMLGGEFRTHGRQVGVECLVQDMKHPATKHLQESYCVEREEIYLFNNYDRYNVHDLLSLDKHPTDKKKLGHYPIAWCKDYGKGKVFYTSLGHRNDVWENKAYQKHILGGIKWVLGLEPGSAALPSRPADAGFVSLFNGKDVTGWHLRRKDGHNSWTVEDGILKNTVNKGDHGTDLVTDAKFWNFRVKCDYMVPDGSNSGFYLRGRHEIQILGDFQKGTTAKGGNGGIYNVKAPDAFVSKPGGQWQTLDATIVGNRITVVLNGKKIHDQVECNRATGGQLDRELDKPGPVLLQGNHGTVWFRNIRLQELPTE
jgi:type 1 glutamine amidotransferase